MTAFEMDTDAIAEGICNSAPGSTIELLLDLLTALVGDEDEVDEGSLVMDAYYYRKGEIEDDTDDEDEQGDLEIAATYITLGDSLIELRTALQTREASMSLADGDNEEDEERYTVAPFGNVWEVLDGGASFDQEQGGRLLRKTEKQAWEEAERLNATD